MLSKEGRVSEPVRIFRKCIVHFVKHKILPKCRNQDTIKMLLKTTFLEVWNFLKMDYF